MKIQILGSGCPKCRALEQSAREAVDRLGIEAVFEKVTDSEAIMEMGVMMTPALAVDGIVRQSGKVLTPDEVTSILSELE